jgi:hypothetical protein
MRALMEMTNLVSTHMRCICILYTLREYICFMFNWDTLSDTSLLKPAVYQPLAGDQVPETTNPTFGFKYSSLVPPTELVHFKPP